MLKLVDKKLFHAETKAVLKTRKYGDGMKDSLEQIAFGDIARGDDEGWAGDVLGGFSSSYSFKPWWHIKRMELIICYKFYGRNYSYVHFPAMCQ